VPRHRIDDYIADIKIKQNKDENTVLTAYCCSAPDFGGKMKIYGLKNCDTCRKAVKLLPSAVILDVRGQPLDEKIRADAYDLFGAALLNTRSTTWRGLDEAERARAPLDLLAAYPALMKRPLIVTEGGDMYLGWTKDVQAALGVQ
jgi:arsenate reductase